MKPLDLDAVLAAWPATEPPDDFADRVLAALDAPARSWRSRPILLFAAVALAVLGTLPFFLGREIVRTPATVARIELDLGVECD